MILKERQNLLSQAEAAENHGNHDEAERLSQEILAALSNLDEAENSSNESWTLRARATRVQGLVSLARGDSPKALEHLHAALHISQQSNHHDGIALVTGNIGLVHMSLSDYPKALEFFGKALSIYEELGDKRGVAANLNSIGNVYESLSDYPKSLEYLEKALRVDEELGDKTGVARRLANIGLVHSNLSDYPRALECYRKSLRLAEELDNKIGMAVNFLNIGVVYSNLSDYFQALDYASRALSIEEELGNKAGIARGLGNIGIVHASLSDYPKALEYYGKALSIDEEIGNKAGVAIFLGNIGHVHMNLLEYPKALEYFGKALRLDEELGYKAGVARHLGNIGRVHTHLSDYTKALECLTNCMGLYAELGHRSEVADSKTRLGDLYLKQDNPNRDEAKGEAYVLESIAIGNDLGTKKFDNHKILAEFYERKERWSEFALHIKRYHQLKDETQSQEARESAAMMEQRRQIAEREKEMAVSKAAADAQMSATTSLLHRVLPASVATRMINGEDVIADYFTNVSILFADIVGFTPIAAQMQARDVLSLLNYVFGEFDRIMEKNGCQKIKTMGDGYMAVCGAPIACDDHAEKLANAALDLLNDIELPESLRSSLPKGSVFHLRIGLHCGPAFAGIVGEKGFVYDVYSDAVNLASRMESHGEAGKIHSSEQFMQQIQNTALPLRFAERGHIDVKGKGLMRTYFLERA